MKAKDTTSDYTCFYVLAMLGIVLTSIGVVMLIVILNENRISETTKVLGGPDFNTEAVGSTACDDGNDCTYDFAHTVEGVTGCDHLEKPTNTSCSNQCLVAESGLCVTGKCKGICNGYCPYYLDFDPADCPTLTFADQIQTAIDSMSLWLGTLCYYGKCTFILEVPLYSDLTCSLSWSMGAEYEFHQNVGDRCLSYLSPSALNSGCITADTLCVDYGTPLCVYHYGCSGFDIFNPEAPPSFGSLKIKSQQAPVDAKEEVDTSLKEEEDEDHKDKDHKNKTVPVPKPPTVTKTTRTKLTRPKNLKVKPSGISPSHNELIEIKKMYKNRHKKETKSPKRTVPISAQDLTLSEVNQAVSEGLGGYTFFEFIGQTYLEIVDER
jgi:hypothetical protein